MPWAVREVDYGAMMQGNPNYYFYHTICLTDILIRIRVLRGSKAYAMKHWVSHRLDDGQKYERKIITILKQNLFVVQTFKNVYMDDY